MMSKRKNISPEWDIAEEIYLSLFGEAKTHTEWADSFNKIGKIVRIISAEK